jgi:hypothetical protein
VDLETVDRGDDTLEVGSVSSDDVFDGLEVRVCESLDESLSSAIDLELSEELCEHVLDFVSASHVPALYEARLSDSEISSAARTRGREVEILCEVVFEERMAVDHFRDPLF